MHRIVIASGNPGKVREIRKSLGELPVEVIDLISLSSVPEPDEKGSTFEENARHKAIYYACNTHNWCLADDSGLVVDALNGAPGVKSARYASDCLPTNATREQIDAANNSKLLAELTDVPDRDRTARFVCHLALSDGEKINLESTGVVEGKIGHQPVGKNGFGYDPLFIAEEVGCSLAQLSKQEKNRISHRGKAVRRFVKLLQKYLDRENEE